MVKRVYFKNQIPLSAFHKCTFFEIECPWLEEGSNLNHHLFGAWGVMFSSLKITIEAMKSDIDEVALQGIEFWSNVCDEEMDLAIEASEVSLGESRFVFI